MSKKGVKKQEDSESREIIEAGERRDSFGQNYMTSLILYIRR